MGQLALFNLGFRPFYLLAGAFAALSVPLWLLQYFGFLHFEAYLSGMLWHAHEMVFGFAVAVITGFLFTAVRNWTNLPTPHGTRLMLLALLWLTARIAQLTGPDVLAAVLDVLFLPCIAAALWLPLKRSKNRRNFFFIGLLLLLACLNLIFHLSQLGVIPDYRMHIVKLAVYIVIIIVSIMGGRVIPLFTGNAIADVTIRQVKFLDQAAIAVLVLTLIVETSAVFPMVTTALCFVAAILHMIRLVGWKPFATLGRPILWILHASYAWIPIGLIILGCAQFIQGNFVSLALHAFTIGAMSGMIIGMMTRTARGHTGRPLQASKQEIIAYTLVHIAAVIRVFLPMIFPEQYATALVASAVSWSGAFLIFTLMYWPILSRPRIDGKPG